MLVTLLPIVTLVSLMQSSNAISPMLVTLFGIVTLESKRQPLNADSPMLVTILGITYSGLVLSFIPVIVISLLLTVK